jgi:DNA-nicking Smr family endonuclease
MAGDIDEEELALFRRELDGVAPLHADRVEPPRRRHLPIPGQRIADDAQVIRELGDADPYLSDNETGEELWFVRPGIQHKVLRKLRRGHFSMGEVLDLHGQTVEQAREAFGQFLGEARAHGVRGVTIIHGKGFRSEGGVAVLKSKVDSWLRRRDEVIAFCSARPVDGGTGAVYVLLKR